VKHAYLTDGTIDRFTDVLHGELRTLACNPRVVFRPAESALLLMDMQRYFFEASSHAFVPSAPCILPRILRLVEAYLRRERPVILTRHLNTTVDAQMMRVWWQYLLEENHPLSAIIPELEERNLPVIEKSQYDAFFETDLDGLLQERGARQLVIAGVMTHLCVETTARSAFVRGYRVFLPMDGTATYREDFHRASFLNLTHGCAVPVRICDLRMALDEKK
jgi:nicotinamidase-related amidase